MDTSGVAASNDTANRKEFSAISSHGQALDTKQAVDEYKKKMKEKHEQENANLWQHPFVDVFKHFKILPGSDWKQNKKQGDVQEYFAKEIGRRAISIEGNISANNFIHLPHPQGAIKALALTGRYIYLQIKCPRHGLPFSGHIDLGMAERSHGIRISVSNLFKNFNTSNGFVAQVPLDLKHNCWTVVVLDIYEILKKSNILPPTYLIDGSYQVRSINLCANLHIRGVFTSDNLYDFVTLPADMRFKFAFDLSKWPEYFHWQTLPQDWSKKNVNGDLGDENMNLQNVINQQKNAHKMSRADQRRQMQEEIDGLLYQPAAYEEEEEVVDNTEDQRKKKYEDMQRQLNMQFNAGPADHPVSGYIVKDDDEGTRGGNSSLSKGHKGTGRTDYRTGQYSGYELNRSHKLNKDPIMELQHIIGYQAEKCYNIKWARQEGEKLCVIFTSGGTLISMDAETNTQKRFFFGHSAPICCFDLNSQGNLIASGQEGKNTIIRIWDYATARCITFMTMPVVSLKCLAFSNDGRYLAGVGKDSHNKELIIVWDISKIQRGDQPHIVAKQTSEFNILCLKFSPIDSSRLASCGKENIRFWRIRDTGNIRGSAVVLNHHARNTVFTCLDFEYGFQSADKDEDEALKRVFVGSKHGEVFQINYQTETLEANYSVNEGAIYSIAVNEAFCVTGSEDSYLRVWPLDFQEFFMEAKHEGTVSAVDISPDGLKVVCGTLYGSIGILDKSNQGYKTLLRSHTDDILALDFHIPKMNIITVSRDKTIRLWDISTYDEVYEFSSPADQPLCVSSHPHHAIFASGFESGKMRIFDMDTTEVLDEFSQFNKPLQALRYDNSGKLLIACCQDGSVSIHNSLRQHLPIKMMHLQMPPEFVHVSFSERTHGDDDVNQKFAVMGEYGNNVVIYDTESFLIQHQVMVKNIIKSFKFSNNNRDLIIVTKDCKVVFYSLMRYEGIFLREIPNCHRGSINGIDTSLNSGYMLTGGEDSMVKIWDYEVSKTVPYFFQSFIGHTYPLSQIIFNPCNNQQIISVSQRDGIYIWDFNGDVETDYKQAHLAGQDVPSMGTIEEKAPSLLEKIRTTHKAKKAFRNQMSEETFIIPVFKPLEQSSVEKTYKEFIESSNIVKQQRIDRKLAYNHYANCSKRPKLSVEDQRPTISTEIRGYSPLMEQKLIIGYDGFGGVHDNLAWNVSAGFTYFTLNNKFIIENTKTREQQVFTDSLIQLSCMAATVDGKLLAVGEGSENPQGQALIYLYDLEKRQILNKLRFHQKGVQSMSFSFDGRYLISLGVQGENTLAVFEISSGSVICNAVLMNYATNQVKVDYMTQGSHVQFITVGNNASMSIWRVDTMTKQLTFYDVSPPDTLQSVNFLSVEFTHFLPSPVGTYYILIGADDGSLIAFNQQTSQYVDLGRRGTVVEGEIGAISVKEKSIVVGSSMGIICHYPIKDCDVQPQMSDMMAQDGRPEAITRFNVESAVVAISMDEQNIEGLIGTEAGCIHYVNFGIEKMIIKLVSSNNHNQDAVDFCRFDRSNQYIYFTNCGKRSDEFKVYTTQNSDQVHNFQANYDDDGYVVFVLGSQVQQPKRQKRLVGYSNGIIKRISLDSLEIEYVFKLPMNTNEVLTCGQYSDNGFNIAFGTNHGTLFIVSLKARHKNRVDASYVRIDNVGKCNQFDNENKSKSLLKPNSDIMNDNDSIDIGMASAEDQVDFTGITSINFPYIDPIGTILISFDDGTIKVWQSTVRNEQHMKILELEQASKKKAPNQPVYYDLAEVFYQQYDLIDSFYIFQNPHGQEEMSESDRNQIKQLYGGKKYHSCNARFAPGSAMSDQYFCWVDALQFIFIRNYQRSEIIKQISLNQFPTSLFIIEFTKLKIDEESAIKDIGISKGNFLVAIGTKEGRILIYRYGSVSTTRLIHTKGGISFGSIVSVDVSGNGEHLLASNETGEIITYDLLKKLNEEGAPQP